MKDDTVLIKLRRAYSKDETVMWALNKISETSAENEKLKKKINYMEVERKQILHGRYSAKEEEYKKLLRQEMEAKNDK